MFGIRHSDKRAEKRLEMWENKEQNKQNLKMIKSAPSAWNMATPGSMEQDRELKERFRRLKEGGRRKRGKSIRIKSMKKKGKSSRRKSMKMY
mgnify:FL=1